MSIVQHWGLHVDGDLVFLHEQDRTRCMTPGLEGLESPFVVETRGKCPHALLPWDDSVVPVEPPSGLARVLGPIPDGGAYWAPPAARPLLKVSHDLCCLFRPASFTPWATPLRRLAPELTLTNLAPLVIFDYEPKDLTQLLHLLDAPRIRTVVLCGPIRPAGVEEVDFTTEMPPGRALLQHHINQIIRKARS